MTSTPVIPFDNSTGTKQPTPFVQGFDNSQQSVVPTIQPTQDPSKMSLNDVMSNLPITKTPNEDNASILTPLAGTERYPKFNPQEDNEEVYAQDQGSFRQAWNGIVKGAAMAASSFAEGMMSIPDMARGISNSSLSAVYKNPIAQSLDNWNESLENTFPNYISHYQQQHPFLSSIPGMGGGANFFFDKIVKNGGMMLGALGAAAVENLAVDVATDGLGAIPALGESIGSLGSQIAKGVGRLSNSISKVATDTDKFTEMLQAANISNDGGKLALGAKDIYDAAEGTRILKGAQHIVATATSSNMMAGQSARQTYASTKKQLEEDFYTKHGYEATGEDATNIEKYATATSNAGYVANLALFSAQNAIAFPNLMKGFSAAESSLKTGLEDASEMQAGTIGTVKEKPEVAEDIDDLKATIPKKSFLDKYINIPSIATQTAVMGAVHGVDIGTKKYFEDQYNGKEKNQLDNFLNSTMEGFKKGFGSQEGLESMLLGGLTGALLGPIEHKIGEMQRAKAGIQSPEDATQTAVSNLRKQTITGSFDSNYDSAANSIKTDSGIQDAVKSGDVFKFKNLKADAFFNFIDNGIRNNRFDVVKDQVRMLKELPTPELNKLFGLDPDSDTVTNHTYIDKLIDKADSMKETADAIDKLSKNNPYNYADNPKTDEEKSENENYFNHEAWKRAVAYNSFKDKDFDERLDSIDKTVRDIHPDLNSDLIEQLTHPVALENLANEYRTQSLLIGKQLDDGGLTTQEYKSLSIQKTQLDTHEELANNASKAEGPNISSFYNLTNFELNNRQSGANKVDLAQVPKLIDLGVDSNKIKDEKDYQNKAYEQLFTPAGIDVFNKSRIAKQDQVKEETITEQSKATQTDNNINAGDKTYEVGRDYENNDIKSKYTAPNKRDEDGLYGLKSPDGKITKFKSLKEAQEARDFQNDNIKDNLSKVIVLGVSPSGRLRVQDSKGNIQLVSPDLLKNHTLIATDEEVVNARDEFNKKVIENQNNAFATSPDYSTPVTQDIEVEDRRPKKSVNIVFNSTTDTPKNTKAYSKRTQKFFSDIDRFKNKADLKAILVTASNEEAWGLKGLTNYLIEGSVYKASSDKRSPIVAVYVEYKGTGINFIGHDGRPLKGDNDINKMVYSTMPTSDHGYDKEGLKDDLRYYGGGKDNELGIAHANAWEKRRQEIFDIKDKENTPIHNFSVSRGRPEYDLKDEDGNYKRNSALGTLIQRSDLNHKVLEISTGEITHMGEVLSFPKGSTILRNGSTLEFLNNRKFNDKEAESLYGVLKEFAGRTEADKGVLDKEILLYLQGATFYGEPKGKEGKSNQIYIDNKGFINIGDKRFPFLEKSFYGANEQLIKDAIKDIYTNSNNKLLRDNLPFREVYAEKNKNEDYDVKSRTWKSYQHYLISDKYDTDDELSGKIRNVEDTPFTTSIRRPVGGDSLDSNFKGKYAILNESEEGNPLFIPEEIKKEEPKSEVISSNKIEAQISPNIVGKYILDNKTENVFKSALGDIKFRAVRTPEGQIGVKLLSEDENPGLTNFLDTKLKNEDTIADVRRLDDDGSAVYEGKNDREKLTNQLEENLVSKIFNLVEANKRAVEAKDLEQSRQEALSVAKEENIQKEVDKAEEVKKEEPKVIRRRAGNEDPQYRIAKTKLDYTIQNIDKEEKWFNDNFSIKNERVKNLIETTGGGYAFGRFYDNAVQVYEGAKKGTYAHEGFEAVWNAFSSLAERKSIISEFNGRKGQFSEYETGKSIKYSEATEYQVKEQLAEELGQYIDTGKLPFPIEKGKKNFIYKLFNDFINFVKKLINPNGTSTKEMFDKINSGFYKTASVIGLDEVATDANYSKISNLSESDSYSIINHAAGSVVQTLLGENRALVEFDSPKWSSKKVFNSVKKGFDNIFKGETEGIANIGTPLAMFEDGDINEAQYRQYMKLYDGISSDWNNVVKFTRERLKTMNIVADLTGDTIDNVLDETQNPESKEDETATYGGNNSDSYVADPFKFDSKRNAAGSIKLLISTITDSEFEDGTNKRVKAKVDSSTLMNRMANYSQTFNFLLKELGNSNTWDEKKASIIEMCKTYPNMIRLANRLGIDPNIGQDKTMKFDDWRLRVKFNSVMSKQSPSALYHYIKGKISTTASLNDKAASKTLTQSWIDGLKESGSKSGIIQVNKDGLYSWEGSNIGKQSMKTPQDQMQFLSKLGISFTPEMYKRLSTNEIDGKTSDRTSFAQTVNSLYKYLSDKKGIVNITGGSLGNAGTFDTLAQLYLKATGDAESTFNDIEGSRRTTFVQPNFISNVNNDINSSRTKEEFLQKLPHMDEKFRSDSWYVNKWLFDEDGNRTQNKLTNGYTTGKVDDNAETQGIEPISTLDAPNRLLEEINLNLSKNYHILEPADATIQWTEGMTHIIPFENFTFADANQKIYNQFKSYYDTERAIALEDGKLNVKYKSLMYDINGDYESETLDKDKLISRIDSWTKDRIGYLKKNGLIYLDRQSNQWRIDNLDSKFLTDNKLSGTFSDKDLNSFFKFTETNYALNNIELHKLFFGDISKVKDPLKRYKSFLSPRETSMYGSDDFLKSVNEHFNKVGNVNLKEGDMFFHESKDYLRTVAIKDLISFEATIINDKNIDDSLKDPYKIGNPADGQGYATTIGHRDIAIKRDGNSSSDRDAMYDYINSRDRQLMYEDGILHDKDGEKGYYRPELKKADDEIVKGGNTSESYMEVWKPIVSGVSNGTYDAEGNKVEEDQLVLDKYSIAPLTYEMVRNTNMKHHYLKMLDQDINYLVMESGRKIGPPITDKLYNDDGTVNKDKFNSITHIPYQFMGIQVETGGTHGSGPLGTQMSTESMLNLRNSGVPIDYKGDNWKDLPEKDKLSNSSIYTDIKRNQNALEAIQDQGATELLKTFGIERTADIFIAPDKSIAAKLLQQELFRREAPSNLKDAISINPKTGEFNTPLEATTNWKQIKDILFGYVDKLIAKPRMNGGGKVQIADFTANKEKLDIKEVKIKGTNKTALASSGLKFYKAKYDKDGNITLVGRMEVMLPMHFRDKIDNHPKWKGKSDDEILEYLNSSEEGKKVLNGIGFRIPTQELNSMEAFTIKSFLPDYMGDAVVVPEAITVKAGSDFDVDKLNTYLKNIYVDSKGDIRTVPYLGVGEKAIDAFKDMAFAKELGKKVKPNENAIDDLNDEDLQDSNNLTNRANKLYKGSLQNEYFESLENILLRPENFNRLIKPNSADAFKAIRDKLVALAPDEFEGTTDKSVLNREYMSIMRHFFITGKPGTAIAASGQKNHSMNQSADVYIDLSRVSTLTRVEQSYIGKADILLPHNTTNINGNTYATVSGIKDKAGDFISDKLSSYIDGFVDIAKDPWIMQIIQHPDLVSQYLFLEKVGVPREVVSMFMNQPIIREYMKILASTNSTGWVYNDLKNTSIGRTISKMFPTSEIQHNIDVKDLASNIEKYYSGKRLTNSENAKQIRILKEFQKYSVMSSNLFDMQRGSTYDTDSAATPNMQYRKKGLTTKAEEHTIFGNSLQDVFENTHTGKLSGLVSDGSEAIAQSLTKINADNVRKYVLKVIDKLPKGLGKDLYDKTSRQVEESFLSYLIQTNTGINGRIKELLVNSETSTVKRIQDLKAKLTKDPESDLANNIFLKELLPVVGDYKNSTKNIQIGRKINDAITADTYTGALRELRDNPITADLYKDIVTTSFLQSGVTNSPIAYHKLLPHEDFSASITPILNNLDTANNLQEFVDTNTFFRNNWNNTDIVPHVKEVWNLNKRKLVDEGVEEYNSRNAITSEPWFNDLKQRYGIGSDSYKYYRVSTESKNGRSEFITFERTISPDRIDLNIDAPTPKINSMLLQRVEDVDGRPIKKSVPGKGDFYIYTPISAWGDGMKAQEHYTGIQPSVLDKNMYNPAIEIPIHEIAEGFNENSIMSNEGISLEDYDKDLENTDKKFTFTNKNENKDLNNISPEGMPPLDITDENNCP